MRYAVASRIVSLGLDGAPVRLFIDAESAFRSVELVRAYPSYVF
jgi:hypothetical protein